MFVFSILEIFESTLIGAPPNHRPLLPYQRPRASQLSAPLTSTKQNSQAWEGQQNSPGLREMTTLCFPPGSGVTGCRDSCLRV